MFVTELDIPLSDRHCVAVDVLSLSLTGPLCVVCVLDSLEEEAETLLKDSDTQDSSIGGHCSTLSADTCAMFRSRHDHDKGA